MRTSIGAKFSQLTRGFQLALITNSKLLLILDSFVEMENGLINMIVLFLSSIQMGKFCHGNLLEERLLCK